MGLCALVLQDLQKLLDTNLQYRPCSSSLLGILALALCFSLQDRVRTVPTTMHMKKQAPCDLQRAASLGGTLGLVLTRAMKNTIVSWGSYRDNGK